MERGGSNVRLATYRVGTAARVGLVVNDRLVDLEAVARRKKVKAPADMIELIADMPATTLRSLAGEAAAWIQAGRASIPVGRARWLAPIPRPSKNITCVGRNYAAHTREGGAAPPEVPVFFTKPPTTVIGPDAPVLYHRVTQELDYEVELAVVVGKRGRNIPASKALDHVFGYTIMNDVTARDLQRRHQQWFKGKSLDTFAPLGPWIVHRSAIANPQNLRLSMRVNGETRQSSHTSQMLFPVAQLIEALSAGTTLEPGDILATGTPEGVGMRYSPPRYLHVGDVMEAEVEGIGILRNRIASPKL
jgi:2-keto-4-pentenoate hydratase/2-oxohepta-3-ene-1,7-dioic acid hydratase in catechol pathway